MLPRLCEYSLLAAIFFLPFSIALWEVFFTVSLIGWLSFKASTRESVAPSRQVLILAILLLATSSVSAFYSGYPGLSARGIFKLIRYMLLMLMVADLFHRPERIKRLIKISVISCSVVLIDAIIQQFLGWDVIRGWKIFHAAQQIRLTGPFKTYGLLAAFLLALLPVIGSLFLSVKRSHFWTRCTFGTLFAVGLYVLYMTHSRGAWLAASGACIVYASITRKKWLIILLTGAFLAAFLFLPKSALIHLDIEGKEQSLVERYHLWNRAIQVIQSRPFFGCGINTYVKNYPRFDKVENWRVEGYYAHNGYLQLAAETGLISLLFFLLLLWRAIRSGHGAFRVSEKGQHLLIAGLLAGFCGLLFQAAVDTTLHNLQSANLIWIFLGLLFAVGKIHKVEI